MSQHSWIEDRRLNYVVRSYCSVCGAIKKEYQNKDNDVTYWTGDSNTLYKEPPCIQSVQPIGVQVTTPPKDTIEVSVVLYCKNCDKNNPGGVIAEEDIAEFKSNTRISCSTQPIDKMYSFRANPVRVCVHMNDALKSYAELYLK